MAIPAFMVAEEASERRSAERWRIRLEAHSLDRTAAYHPLMIFDVSESGMLLETDQPLQVGSQFIVEMSGNVARACETVWNCGRFHGATFSEPLSQVQLRELINTSTVVWPSFGDRPIPPSITDLVDPPPQFNDHIEIDDEAKLPPAVRFVVIVGASAALWTLIGTGIWLAAV